MSTPQERPRVYKGTPWLQQGRAQDGGGGGVLETLVKAFPLIKLRSRILARHLEKKMLVIHDGGSAPGTKGWCCLSEMLSEAENGPRRDPDPRDPDRRPSNSKEVGAADSG